MTYTRDDVICMKRAIELAREGMLSGTGGPFGCVIARDGMTVGEGSNCVTSTNDPTAHAEVVAIRATCQSLNSFELTGCTIYTSCEPCPMCLGAIYWARPARVLYAATKSDAKRAGFDDEHFYSELAKVNDDRELSMENILREESVKVFDEWLLKVDKVAY